MAEGSAYVLAFAAIFVAIFGWIFVGGLALYAAVVLVAFAVMALAAETTRPVASPPVDTSRGFRYACPGCGGDVYSGQAVCHACGRSLIGVQAAKP